MQILTTYYTSGFNFCTHILQHFKKKIKQATYILFSGEQMCVS